MLDDDIKKILNDLNMTHFLEEDNKLAAVPVSENHKRNFVLDEDDELWQKEEDKGLSPEQIALVNKQLVSHKKLYIWIALATIFLVALVCSLSGPATEKETVKPKSVIKKENVNTEDLFDARKAALRDVSEEINALISRHAENKIDSFASSLTSLAAKCQAVDEEYTMKIAIASKERETLAQK